MLTVNWPRARRIKALALILVLSLFAFEAALHSTHHLTYLSQATQCGIASASAHLAGTAVESVAIEKPVLVPEIVPGASPSGSFIACLGPAQGRAPPPLLA